MRNLLRTTLGVSVVLGAALLAGCVELKDAGRTVGHTSRDVAREIGHASRDVAKDIKKGATRVLSEREQEN